jgi:hypothetical protein
MGYIVTHLKGKGREGANVLGYAERMDRWMGIASTVYLKPLLRSLVPRFFDRLSRFLILYLQWMVF